MGTKKNNGKVTLITETVAKVVQEAIQRWTAKSPKSYQVITNIAIGAGLAASVITLIPISYPVWVLPVASMLVAIAAKFTIEK